MNPIQFAEIAARQMLAIVLFAAGIVKLLDVSRMAGYIKAYHILPVHLVPIAERYLPRLELLLSVLIMLGVALRPMLLFAAALFAIFTLGQILILAKGGKVPCGCFGNSTDLISSKTVLRSSGLIGLTLFCLFRTLYPANPFVSPAPTIYFNWVAQLSVTALVGVGLCVMQIGRNDAILAGGGLATTIKDTPSLDNYRMKWGNTRVTEQQNS